MNFFRLRVVNTLLIFVAGILLGFLFKDRFSSKDDGGSPAAAYQQPPAGQPSGYGYSGGEEYAEDEPAAEEDPAEDYPVDNEGPRPSVSISQEPAAPASAAQAEPAAVIEPSRRRASAPGPQEDAFFADPAAFSGRELELRLQMITAKKADSGWRLNLVYTSPAKRMEYLYVDDTGVLSSSPDLRIGYFYKVRFVCGKGTASSGNLLVSIEGTGEKAGWATGLSAVE